MPAFTGDEQEFEGPFGKAIRIGTWRDNPDYAATVDHWLITHPQGHPLWSQYLLVGISLAEYPNMRPPVINVPGATHEIMLAVLHPDEGTQTAETLKQYSTPGNPKYGRLQFLTPINISWQFNGTDEECIKLLNACTWGVVNGHLWPETSDAPFRVRHIWADSLTKTLAHFRGEHEGHDHAGAHQPH